MKLVINGDDLGYTMANTLGIIEAYKKGILRSTTALCNSDYLEQAKKLCDENPGLGVGVHLTCTLGKSLTKNKTLTDENGYFFEGRKTIWTKDVDYDELYLEWKAQIDRYISVFGHLPTHLDSHHSVHDATPQALETAKKLANEYGIEMRRYGSYQFVAGFYGPLATTDNLIELLEKHKDQDIEIMCHPGYCDLELYQKSSYSLDRVKELAVLCDEKLISYIKDNNIELVHY